MLNRAAGDRDFRNAPAGRVEQNVRGRFLIRGHVALDVAAGDMHVPHLAADADDAALLAIADVRADDIV